MKGLQLRIWCLLQNKYTCPQTVAVMLLPFALYTAVSRQLWVWIWVDSLAIVLCIVYLALTGFAQNTVTGYTRTMQHFERFGRIKRRFVYRMILYGYCFELGARIAGKELVRTHGSWVAERLANKHN